MADKFFELAFTPSVLEAQERYFGRTYEMPEPGGDTPLGPAEAAFIASRDSFYIASTGETGWPYVQHRGGPAGFCRVLSPNEIAFADYRGNRQMVSTGNLAANDKVCLFLMDYPDRRRLKILGRAEVLDAREHPELVAEVAGPENAGVTERLFRIRVVTYDWNCPKYITPRYTEAEIAEMSASAT